MVKVGPRRERERERVVYLLRFRKLLGREGSGRAPLKKSCTAAADLPATTERENSTKLLGGLWYLY